MSEKTYLADRIRHCVIISLFALLFCTICLSADTGPAFAAGSNASNKGDQDVLLQLTARKFKELEAILNAYLSDYERGTISDVQLYEKFLPFDSGYGRDDQFDEWVRSYPKSYAAVLARGIYRVSDAGAKRGSKFASFTTDNQFALYQARLKEAVADLELSLSLSPRPVLSYCYLLVASKGITLNTGPRALLDEALRIDPTALRPRMTYLWSITPKWGGSTEEMHEFLKESRRSVLSRENLNTLEKKYLSYLAEDATLSKDYRAASDLWYKHYELDHQAETLWKSGEAACDGGLNELALERMSELIRDHPKYVYGYTNRGNLYEVVYRDLQKAFDDYKSASDLGNSWAQNRLGWWYMNGIHVKQDFVIAQQYLIKALLQKNQTARENLEYLEKLKMQQARGK